jgi:predicted phosphodiesterase
MKAKIDLLKTTRLLIVGDIHGKHSYIEAAAKLAQDRECHLVFVGDFLDSFDHDSVQCVACLETALSLQNRGRATVLAGNHETSYLYPQMECSGFRTTTYHMIQDMEKDLRKELYSFIYYEDVELLITHAGLHRSNYQVLNEQGELNHTTWYQELAAHCITAEGTTSSIPYAIGRSRGGSSKVGGIFWCDWGMEFIPSPVNQICGHTRLSNGWKTIAKDDIEAEEQEWLGPNGSLGPVRKKNLYIDQGNSPQKIFASYCIDCLDVEPIVVEAYIDDNGTLCVNPLSLNL